MEASHHEGLAKSKSISQLHFNAINNAASSKHKYPTASNGTPDETRKLLPNQKRFIITPAASTTSPPASGSGSTSSSSSATSPQPISQNGSSSYTTRSPETGTSPVLTSVRPMRPTKSVRPMGKCFLNVLSF